MTSFFKKTVGVTAALTSALVYSHSASALNLSIGNLVSNGSFRSQVNTGQSFVNDPDGTGATINLDTWTFAFDQGTESTALQSILTIYSGAGNGGSVIGTSSNSSNSTLSRFSRPVTWTFTGGLEIVDNAVYSAVLAPSLFYISNLTLGGRAYPNGTLTRGTLSIPDGDTIFQGAFSAATPVPFEFNPAIGLGLLGGAWLVLKVFKKKG